MPQNTDGTLQACRGGNILSSARSTIHVGPNKCLLRSLRGRKTYPPPPPPPTPFLWGTIGLPRVDSSALLMPDDPSDPDPDPKGTHPKKTSLSENYGFRDRITRLGV